MGEISRHRIRKMRVKKAWDEEDEKKEDAWCMMRKSGVGDGVGGWGRWVIRRRWEVRRWRMRNMSCKKE
jgi:hypothetical protein